MPCGSAGACVGNSTGGCAPTASASALGGSSSELIGLLRFLPKGGDRPPGPLQKAHLGRAGGTVWEGPGGGNPPGRPRSKPLQTASSDLQRLVYVNRYTLGAGRPPSPLLLGLPGPGMMPRGSKLARADLQAMNPCRGMARQIDAG
eukprot:9158635-Alexandrium_andersonii.AAC.1